MAQAFLRSENLFMRIQSMNYWKQRQSEHVKAI